MTYRLLKRRVDSNSVKYFFLEHLAVAMRQGVDGGPFSINHYLFYFDISHLSIGLVSNASQQLKKEHSMLHHTMKQMGHAIFKIINSTLVVLKKTNL